MQQVRRSRFSASARALQCAPKMSYIFLWTALLTHQAFAELPSDLGTFLVCFYIVDYFLQYLFFSFAFGLQTKTSCYYEQRIVIWSAAHIVAHSAFCSNS